MKMIVAIVQDDDAKQAMDGLVRAGFGVTRLASTGGWLRHGSTTLLCGIEEGDVERALELLDAACEARDVTVAHGHPFYGSVERVRVGGAVVFVLDVDRFVRL